MKQEKSVQKQPPEVFYKKSVLLKLILGMGYGGACSPQTFGTVNLLLSDNDSEKKRNS